MKFLLFVLLLYSTLCSAQEYKKLRIGIGSGYANVAQEYYGLENPNQILFYVEPSFRLNDKISVGSRLEITRGKSVASFTINGQYYWMKKSQTVLRPFVGLGIGFYHPYLSGDVHYGTTSHPEQAVFGFYPRIGFDFHHLCILVDWNFGSSADATIYPPVSSQQPPYNGKLSPNYFSAKIGFFIGGGKKK